MKWIQSWNGEVLTLRDSPNVNGHKYSQNLTPWQTWRTGHRLTQMTSRNTGGSCEDVVRGYPQMDRTWLCPGLRNKLLKNNEIAELLRVDNEDIKATRWRRFSLEAIAYKQNYMWRNKGNIRNEYWTPLNTLEHICGRDANEMTPLPF